MLYVSSDEGLWDIERNQLKLGDIEAYAFDLNGDLNSEFGSIGITGINGRNSKNILGGIKCQEDKITKNVNR